METLKLFNYDKTPLKIDKPIRLIELFAGVGSQAKALQRLGADFEHYKISEWEINATASYKAIHKGNDNTDYSAEFTNEQLAEILFNIGISTDGKKPLTLKEISRKNEQWKRTVYNNFKATNNIGSILNVSGAELGVVDTDKFTYLLTYSFPCQDLSLAGKQKGMAKGENTRSGLLWEVERLLNECTELPQILLMENVTQVHGTKNKEHFNEWIAFLESKGYSNYWKDLNAKNFGIPQNRNRTFMVSVLGDYTYEFPKEFPLQLRLKNMLEDSVDEKFYISDAKIDKIVNSNFGQEKSMIQKNDVCGTLLARDYKDPKCIEVKSNIVNGDIARTVRAGGKGSIDRHSWDLVAEPVRLGNIYGENCGTGFAGNVWDKTAISPALMTMQGGNRQPMVIDEPKVIGGIGEKKSNGGTQWYQQDRIYDDKVAISVTTAFNPYYAVQENEIIDPFICASRGRNPENPSDRTAGIPTEQRLEPNFSGCSNTLTTVQKDNYVCEPQVLRAERTEYGKSIRKQYEAGEISEKIGNMREMNPRTDGVSNTITTVQKDNYLVEPIVCEQRKDEGLRFFKGDYVGTLRTIDACGDKRVIEPTINKVDIPQTVRVRKYEVDCEKLCEVLRNCKHSSGLKNQDIAQSLGIPLTKVEHWFRQDNCFAIPDEDIWFKLKSLLCIDTDEFDESIMTFEEREGVFEKSNRCYFSDGLAPTLTSTSADEKIIEPLAYDEQNGYIRKDGTVGTLTTDGSSPKHNNRVIENCYVSEKGVKFICSPKRGMTTDINADVCQPLTAKGQANWTGSFISPNIENLEKSSTIGSTEPTKINLKNGETITSNDNLSHLRIRKLTPKECWRLMGFDDADFEKAAVVNSNSQLYKQAGNSIVVDVLYYIFKEMF